jgi:hypothetical protein
MNEQKQDGSGLVTSQFFYRLEESLVTDKHKLFPGDLMGLDLPADVGDGDMVLCRVRDGELRVICKVTALHTDETNPARREEWPKQRVELDEVGEPQSVDHC